MPNISLFSIAKRTNRWRKDSAIAFSANSHRTVMPGSAMLQNLLETVDQTVNVVTAAMCIHVSIITIIGSLYTFYKLRPEEDSIHINKDPVH